MNRPKLRLAFVSELPGYETLTLSVEVSVTV